MRSIDQRAARVAAYVVVFSIALLSTDTAAWAQYGGLGMAPGLGGAFAADLSTGQKLLMMVVSGLAGGLLGVLISPALKTFRRAFYILAAVLVFVFALFGEMFLADGLTFLFSAIIFFVALNYAKKLGQQIKKAIAAAPPTRPTSFGSAQWATLKHLLDNGVINNGGFILGEFPTNTQKGNVPIQYKGERHMLTVAPTRSGKGVSSIIPNLLMYEGSALVVDPKGENALVTAMRRCEGSKDIPGMNQNVYLVDPWNLVADQLCFESACFNPLDWIKADDPDAAENAMLLADAMIMTDDTSQYRFWDDEAKAFLMGIILHVAIDPEEECDRTLGRVRDILTLNEEGFKAVMTDMFNSDHPIVKATAARQAAKEARLYSNVLATVQSHTHFLDSGRIRQSLAKSDFSFEDLKTKPTTIYLILPADRLKTFDRWLRLLIQQAITVNARNIEKKPEKPIIFFLDEMPTLGRLPAIEQAYGLMAGFGMQLWGIVQDLSQLAKVYGNNGWQTFISNSGVIQYFGSRDKMTAEYFSSLCGVTTIESHNLSWAVGQAVGKTFGYSSGGSSSSTNNNDSWTRTNGANEAQRQLAYPDELMVLKGHQEIVFVENLDPIAAQKVVWYKHPKYRALGVNLHADTEEVSQTPAPALVQTKAPTASIQKPSLPVAAQKLNPPAAAAPSFAKAAPFGTIVQAPTPMTQKLSGIAPAPVVVDDDKLKRLADNLSSMGRAKSPNYASNSSSTSPDRYRGKPGSVANQNRKKKP